MSVLIALSHGGACVLAFLLPVPLWLSLCAAGAVTAGAWHAARLHVLRRLPQAVAALHWRDDGEWELTTASGMNHEGLKLAGCYTHQWLVILYFSPARGWRRHPVVLPRDSLDGDGFRRLRVRLRLDR